MRLSPHTSVKQLLLAPGVGFGVDQLGIQRRAYTSGDHKAFLDPFEPEKPDETKFWQGVLNVIERALHMGPGLTAQLDFNFVNILKTRSD